MKKLIRISFSTVTPESAEHGDTSETGWIDEEGYEIEWDESDGESPVTQTVKFLRREGALQPSCDPTWNPGAWYATGYQIDDYRTGEETERCYHLDGFTSDEERAIYAAIKQASHV